MKTILVDDCVELEKDHCSTYAQLIELLGKKLSLQGGEIMTVTAYTNLESPEDRRDKWKNLRALCLHADSGYTSMVADACREGIPVILFRDDGAVKWGPWLEAFRSAGMENLTLNELESGRLFYFVNEYNDIKGAVKWITDYYYQLRKNIARLLEGVDSKKQRDAKEEIHRFCLEE